MDEGGRPGSGRGQGKMRKDEDQLLYVFLDVDEGA